MFKKVQSSFFSGVVARAGISSQVQAAQILVDAEQWLVKEFGEGIEKFVTPVYLKNHILHISCTHPAIAEEIHHKEEVLLQVLRSEHPYERIHAVRFVVPKE